MKPKELADQLHSYMTFRAAKENMPHTLDKNFYLQGILQGVAFFGIHYDVNGIVSDAQNPTALEEWRANQTVAPTH